MWAIGRYDLGLGEDDFWSLTPAQFFALRERWRERLFIEDYFTARVAHILTNVHRDHEKRPTPVDIDDVMMFKPERKVEQPKQDWRALKANFDDFINHRKRIKEK